MVALEMRTVLIPVFVTVSVCKLLEPIAMFPKVKLAELAASVPLAAPFEPVFPGLLALVIATQPDRVKLMSINVRMANKAGWLRRLRAIVESENGQRGWVLYVCDFMLRPV